MRHENRVEMHVKSIIGEHVTIILENVQPHGAQLLSVQLGMWPNSPGVAVALKREDMVTLHKQLGEMLGEAPLRGELA